MDGLMKIVPRSLKMFAKKISFAVVIARIIMVAVAVTVTVANTISLGSHQNIGLHTGARVNVVLLTYLLGLYTMQ